MGKPQLLAAIRKAARGLRVKRLTGAAFRRHSGLPIGIVHKHFGRWSAACAAAGVACGLAMRQDAERIRMREEACLSELRRVAGLLGRKTVTCAAFARHGAFSPFVVTGRFGTWNAALERAGLEWSAARRGMAVLTEADCVEELQRVAVLLNTAWLTAERFTAHGRFSAHRVQRACGSWRQALAKAGLGESPRARDLIPLATLARELARVAVDLGRLPTFAELARRTDYPEKAFSKPWDGYPAFKRHALAHLLAPETRLAVAEDLRAGLAAEYVRLTRGSAANARAPAPRRLGRPLNFRAFAHAPTCEQEVVQLFGAVAGDLGFEILATRTRFPDCEARRAVQSAPPASVRRGLLAPPASVRRGWQRCRIEFEHDSRDFKAHGHPPSGCDLIVCWRHTWAGCPVEVLELESAIQKLGGWR